MCRVRRHRRRTRASKAEPQAETQLSLVGQRACDFGIPVELVYGAVGVEYGVRNVRTGIVEMWCIRGVERFRAKLDSHFLPHGKLAEQSEVHTDQSRSAENIQAAGPVPDRRHRGERERIEIGLAGAGSADDP